MNKFLKLFVLIFLQFVVCISLYSQKDVTQFLGIPVDGSKPEMIRKLKDKGFTISPDNKEVLVGEFNGTQVYIHVVTNNNKVWRIMISDVNSISEMNIKIRFNKLCQQFQNNKKYISESLLDSDYTILENEDISYQIALKEKRYEAVYYQIPLKEVNAEELEKEVHKVLLKKYTEKQLSNPTEEIQNDIMREGAKCLMDLYSKKVVWFMISDYYGKYSITMFYDNEYNKANGEDF